MRSDGNVLLSLFPFNALGGVLCYTVGIRGIKWEIVDGLST